MDKNPGNSLSPSLWAALKKDSFEIRKRFLKMHFDAHSGHIGTGLSCIDLLTYVYKNRMRPQDRFILSKGHGASSLYATLKQFGIFSDAEIESYYKDGTLLPAHPVAGAFEAIPAATGSLGHGLPIANGLAYAFQHLLKSDARVTVLLSDGECNEGSIWEGALFASHHNLSQLTVIVDANGLQGFGRSEDVMNMEPFTEKWKAFGFRVCEVNGHDFESIHSAFAPPSSEDRRPLCVLARTVKGKGVSFMENKMEWHYLPMEPEHYQKALQDLEGSAS